MRIKKYLRGIIFFLFIAISFRSVSQSNSDELLSKVWQFKMVTVITESDRIGDSIKPINKEIADRDYQFRVINILKNGKLVIKFLFWKVKTEKGENGFRQATELGKLSVNGALNERFYMNNYMVNNFTNKQQESFRYFIIDRTDFDTRCEEKLPKRQFSVGAMTMPIKIRFGEKNDTGVNKSYTSFSGNVSLGLSFGLKQNFNRSFSLNYLTGFSLSSVPVSAETTNNFVQSETNQAAITWHVGVLASINNFQIGIFSGIDYLSGKVNKEWVYKNKPWLGIGIGYSFFNQKKTSDSQ